MFYIVNILIWGSFGVAYIGYRTAATIMMVAGMCLSIGYSWDFMWGLIRKHYSRKIRKFKRLARRDLNTLAEMLEEKRRG